MATNKPRITITLKEADYAVLKRLNALNGVPMARSISELVEVVTPVLARISDNLEKVRMADENVKKSLLNSAERSLSEMEEIYAVALDNLDMFSAELGEAVEKAQVSGGGHDDSAMARGVVAADAKRPPSSNTGVRKQKRTGLGG